MPSVESLIPLVNGFKELFVMSQMFNNPIQIAEDTKDMNDFNRALDLIGVQLEFFDWSDITADRLAIDLICASHRPTWSLPARAGAYIFACLMNDIAVHIRMIERGEPTDFYVNFLKHQLSALYEQLQELYPKVASLPQNYVAVDWDELPD